MQRGRASRDQLVDFREGVALYKTIVRVRVVTRGSDVAEQLGGGVGQFRLLFGGGEGLEALVKETRLQEQLDLGGGDGMLMVVTTSRGKMSDTLLNMRMVRTVLNHEDEKNASSSSWSLRCSTMGMPHQG